MKHILACAVVLLAGCASPTIAPSGCQTACAVDAATYPDWVLPEGAEAVLAFDADHGRMQAVGRAGDTWVWVVERDGRLIFETWHDDITTSHPLPAGEAIRRDALAADERGAWFVHHGDGATLVSWSVENGSLVSTPLPGMTGAAWLRGVGRDGAVIAGTFDGALGAGLWNGAWTSIGNGVIDADIRGNVIIYAARSGYDDAPMSVKVMDAVTGTELNITVTAAVTSVSADGGLAFVVATSDGPEHWRIDEATHEVTKLGRGDRPAFIDRARVYVDQDVGDPPHVRYHSDVTNSSAAAFYLQPRTVWTTTGAGVAWVEPPSIDPRFIEAENPTTFSAALYER